MPHGWAVAEFWLLMRDSILFEEEDRLILLAGVPPEWFGDARGMRTGALPTYFGTLSIDYSPGRLTLGGMAAPPGGFVLRLPDGDRKLTRGVNRL